MSPLTLLVRNRSSPSSFGVMRYVSQIQNTLAFWSSDRPIASI